MVYSAYYLIRSIVDDGKCYALAYYHVHLSLPPFLPGVDRQSPSTLLGPGHTLEPIWGLIGSATLTRQLRRPILLLQRFSLGVQLPALGIETDYQGTSADAREVILGAPPGFVPITNIFHAKIESIGTVRARLGGLLRPDLLAYVTGGWAYGLVRRQWEMAFTEDGAFVLGTSGENEKFSNGWTAGTGLEWALADHVTLGGEYLFVRLEGDRFSNDTFFHSPGFENFACANPVSNCNFDVNGHDIDNHILRVKLNYKF